MTTATIPGTSLVLMSVWALSGQAPSPTAFPIVQVRVFTHAAVDAPTVQLAKTTASTLLESGRIGTEWQDCGTAESACEAGNPVQVNVLMLPVAKMTEEDVSGEVVQDQATRTPTVLVYLPNLVDRVRIVRQSAAGRSNPALATLQLGHLVGLAIAHEVGHVFGLPHTESGVMKARLGMDDLIALHASRLAFTPRDSAALRLALVARARQGTADGR